MLDRQCNNSSVAELSSCPDFIDCLKLTVFVTDLREVEVELVQFVEHVADLCMAAVGEGRSGASLVPCRVAFDDLQLWAR